MFIITLGMRNPFDDFARLVYSHRGGSSSFIRIRGFSPSRGVAHVFEKNPTPTSR